ncbi:MBL fold metallo-hydrolase [Sporomusa acidovorans]|uniref:Metallo-beta-lactamase domain-containing protein n=1 Tax=Sporomusa acidovorans (strain ATCC 49682 / DSM 3132 / Mol) TaxID=1123286 RepID=A0ABZ3J8G7_SPOA4|nr:MBL fold metallo-hydrolase [Sporomusa acidovorans]OZC16693.1 hydroxyacylglutathione hydrolase [Sporomusa acidovorans DSM 3132]SDE05783.1 Metallo-beta-lactamase superfamily protein [Sporomusa acidovorans]
MNYLLSQLTAGAYVIAVEDTHTWDVRSYTNCYVLRRSGQLILIDAGLPEYQSAIVDALARIRITPDRVTDVLLTHGHHDHAEGAALFNKARKYVHPADKPMLPAQLAAEFMTYVPLPGEFTFAAEGVDGLEIVLVNTHSPGSVAIYDQLSGALFVGDFFCYFGESLPQGELVTNSNLIKQGSCDYVAGQAAAGEPGLDRFMLGLGRLLEYRPEFFCTGHGVVVRQDIQAFLKKMWQSGSQKRPG